MFAFSDSSSIRIQTGVINEILIDLIILFSYNWLKNNSKISNLFNLGLENLNSYGSMSPLLSSNTSRFSNSCHWDLQQHLNLPSRLFFDHSTPPFSLWWKMRDEHSCGTEIKKHLKIVWMKFQSLKFCVYRIPKYLSFVRVWFFLYWKHVFFKYSYFHLNTNIEQW